MGLFFRLFIGCFAALLFFASTQAQAALTVAAVSKALNDALNKFNSTLSTAGSEVRSSGASLTTNAQNLLTDINTHLGGRLTDSIDQLQGAQRQLANDALELEQKLQQATTDIVEKSTDEARATIGDADILAYNSSYSLPCRTLTSRVVYYRPSSLRVGFDTPEVHLKGNFLDVGSTPSVKIDNEPGRVLARSRNEMVIAIPQEVLVKYTDARSMVVSLELQEAKRTNFWLYCWDRIGGPVSSSTAIPVKPQISYVVPTGSPVL